MLRGSGVIGLCALRMVRVREGVSFLPQCRSPLDRDQAALLFRSKGPAANVRGWAVICSLLEGYMFF